MQLFFQTPKQKITYFRTPPKKNILDHHQKSNFIFDHHQKSNFNFDHHQKKQEFRKPTENITVFSNTRIGTIPKN